jgi:tetratricopeptide (TPR) repeat protein
MSIAPRIDELRKKFEENPRRYFAPLANELRKAGDLAQAIALCREHLPRQPGHMSGHIVFGQALYENGDLREARTVFEQALALDPENLIALRHLGDIARQLGDAAVARRWYERVLDADPRNDDIAAQLTSLGNATPVRVAAVTLPAAAIAVAPPVHELIDVDLSVLAPPRVAPPGTAAVGTTDPESMAEAGSSVELPTLSALRASGEVDAVPDKEGAFFDLDGLEAAAEEADAFAGAEARAAADPFFGPSASDGTDREAQEPDGEPELSFEEGLVAAAWPDTAALAARVGTPRILTPAVELPAAAAEAFGREPADAISAIVPGIEPDEIAVVESAPDQAMPEAAAPDLTGGIQVATSILAFEDDTDESLVDELVELVDTTAVESVAASSEAHELTIAADATPIDIDLYDTAALSAVSDDSALGWIAAPEALAESPITSEHEDEATPDDTVGVLATADADAPIALFAEAESEPLGVAEADTDDAELPWLAAPVTPNEEVSAIVEAFAEDARAMGEADDVSVIAMPERSAPEPVAAARESSFASVLDAPDSASQPSAAIDGGIEQEASVPVSPPPAEHNAFVTETMGELLVAQGFLDRAIDVFEELVRRRPGDPAPAARLAELRAQAAPVPSALSPRVTPLHSAALVRTARARFAALAARRVDRRTPAHASVALTPPMGQTAQRSIATPVHTPVVASGPTPDTPVYAFAAVASPPEASLDTLFGSRSTPTEDEAAQMFASAFGDAPSEQSSASFFGSGSMSAVREPTPSMGSARYETPMGTTSVAPTPHDGADATDADPGAARSAFSFDRFFPDPALARPASGSNTPVSPASAPSTPASSPEAEGKTADDLAQFSVWLKGLGNP